MGEYPDGKYCGKLDSRLGLGMTCECSLDGEIFLNAWSSGGSEGVPGLGNSSLGDCGSGEEGPGSKPGRESGWGPSSGET